MKVKELIAKLQKMDGEAEVVVTLTDDPNVPLTSCNSVEEGDRGGGNEVLVDGRMLSLSNVVFVMGFEVQG